jgi:multiple sugar transport system ATP-binding protein
MAALTLHGISKRFGAVNVLDDVSLDVQGGEFVALLGASGSGKSTLLRIIAGLETPDRGAVHIGGRPATERPPAERDVAMVFQNYALYPHKTVAENIALPLEMRRLNGWQRLPGIGALSRQARATRQQIAGDVRGAAAIVGIERLLDRRPNQLSGGQQQRVALARAMVRRPRLLLMDEPLSNLDAKLRTRMRAEISELHARIKSTIVYVTHDQAEAMTMANRIAVMVDGRIVQIGPPQELYNEPCDVRVAEMLGNPSINLVDGHVLRDHIEAGGLRLPIGAATLHDGLAGGTSAGSGSSSGAAPKSVRVGFRPEAAQCLPASSHASHAAYASSATNAMKAANATVVRTEHLGAEVLLHLALAGEQRVIVRQDASFRAAPGDRLHLRVPTSKLLLFDEHGARLLPRAAIAGAVV